MNNQERTAVFKINTETKKHNNLTQQLNFIHSKRWRLRTQMHSDLIGHMEHWSDTNIVCYLRDIYGIQALYTIWKALNSYKHCTLYDNEIRNKKYSPISFTK